MTEAASKSPSFLVVGAHGLLGTDLVPALVSHYSSDQVTAWDKDELDLTDARAVESKFAALKPTWVVNTSGYTNVDLAESERDLATALNAHVPAILATACEKSGSRLLHFSTDQVFDGKSSRPWLETDKPNPLNHYAQTKLDGEKAVLEYSKALVLRVQWLYGKKKNRFTVLRDKESFASFNDQIGSPTWASHVGAIAAQFLEKNPSGLYHFAYDDSATWSEVFQFVKEVMGYRVKLTEVTTETAKLPAKRPLYNVMSNKKLSDAMGLPGLGSWKLALTTFLSGVRF